MHIRQRLYFVKSRDKEMFLFIYAASGPLHCSLHLHRRCVIMQAFCGLTANSFGGNYKTAAFSTVNRTIKTEIQIIYDLFWFWSKSVYFLYKILII